MTIYRKKQNTPALKHKEVRSSLTLNKAEIKLSGEFYISHNEEWAADLVDQNTELKASAQTTPILFSKTPGLIMKWWEN